MHLTRPHLPIPHLPIPHLPARHPSAPHLPALLLSVLYAVAVAVAVTAPGEHALAGIVVLTGLVARWAMRHRHRAAIPDRATVPAPAPATPA